MADDSDNTLDMCEPEFTRETRVVDFGQSLQPHEEIHQLARGDPLPEQVVVRFRTIRGPGPETQVEMRKPMVILGRVEGIVDVVINDEAASRYHACVIHQDGAFVLTDMGSTNGTFVNRKRVGDMQLASGDQIRIGVTVLAFEIIER